MQVALHHLGEAHVAVGNLETAETAFIESLAAAEQMSMFREMLGMLGKIATVRALTGRQVDAVDLNATVVTDPGSGQSLLTATETIDEGAAAELVALKRKMDPDEYAAAFARGTATPYDVSAKDSSAVSLKPSGAYFECPEAYGRLARNSGRPPQTGRPVGASALPCLPFSG